MHIDWSSYNHNICEWNRKWKCVQIYVELLILETTKILVSTKSKITKDKSQGNVPHLEITEVVLVHCKTVNSECQNHSKVLYTFVPNKSYSQLLDILTTK